jgi:hypothetical protein
MAEIKPHQFEKDLAFTTGLDNKLLGARCKIGQILHITHIAGAFVNCATTEYIVLGYYNGHAFTELHKDKPAVTSDYVHWNGDVWLREGQYIYAYYADVASGEVMRLRAEGKYE